MASNGRFGMTEVVAEEGPPAFAAGTPYTHDAGVDEEGLEECDRQGASPTKYAAGGTP